MLLAVLVVVMATTVGWLFQQAYMWGYLGLAESDLVIFRAAGRAVLDGVPLYSLHFAEVGGWTWPPFGALIMVPLTFIPEPWLMPSARAADAAMLATIVWLCSGELRRRVAPAAGRGLLVLGLSAIAAALTPVADVIGLGQIGLLLLLLCTIDLVVVSGRAPRMTGILVGLATAVKVTPGIFIVHFAVTRQWRAAITSALTVLACWSLAAVALWGDSSTYWSNGLLLKVNERIDGFGSWVFNQSWMGLVDGLPEPWPVLLWAGLSTVTLVVALRAAFHADRAGNPVLVLGLVGLASVLITPVAWHHHAVWVVPGLLALLGDGRTRWRLASAGVLALGLMVPSRFPTGVPDLFVVLYALLGLLLLALPDARRAPRSRGLALGRSRPNGVSA